jgi:hypothetical protein
MLGNRYSSFLKKQHELEMNEIIIKGGLIMLIVATIPYVYHDPPCTHLTIPTF